MKKITILWSLILLLLLSGCSKDKNAIETNSNGINIINHINASDKGTRSNPYILGEKFQFQTKVYGIEEPVVYTFSMKEFWNSDRVKSEYPTYKCDYFVITRAQMQVDCQNYDADISYDISFVYLTDSMNEIPAQTQNYIKGDFSSPFWTVYSGGEYDLIVLASKETDKEASLKYLKINYLDVNNSMASIWVEIPTGENMENDNSKEESEYIDSYDLYKSLGGTESYEEYVANLKESESVKEKYAGVSAKNADWEKNISFSEYAETKNVAGVELLGLTTTINNCTEEDIQAEVVSVYVNDNKIKKEFMVETKSSVFAGKEGKLVFWASGEALASAKNGEIDKLGMEVIIKDKNNDVVYKGISWMNPK